MTVVVAAGWFVLSVVLTTLLMIPVSSATYTVNMKEGDFRFTHARVREFSEAIALCVLSVVA